MKETYEPPVPYLFDGRTFQQTQSQLPCVEDCIIETDGKKVSQQTRKQYHVLYWQSIQTVSPLARESYWVAQYSSLLSASPLPHHCHLHYLPIPTSPSLLPLKKKHRVILKPWPGKPLGLAHASCFLQQSRPHICSQAATVHLKINPDFYKQTRGCHSAAMKHIPSDHYY